MPRPLDPRKLGIEPLAGGRVHRIPIPIPFPLDPVNAYVVRGREAIVLVDTGTRTDDAWDALVRGFAKLRLSLDALDAIVVTHGHVDHHGQLDRIADAAPDARLFAPEGDLEIVVRFTDAILDRADDYGALAALWGLPRTTRDGVRAFVAGLQPLARRIEGRAVAPIVESQKTIEVGDVALDVIHSPGHTRGLVCLRDPLDGLLFSNDHVLERITPNPDVYIPPYRGERTGLGHYLESLARMGDLDVSRVCPGHGASFGGYRARLDEIRDHHRARASRLLRCLDAAEGRPNVVELAGRLWRGLKPDALFLACKEVHGHLDLLEKEGRVERSLDGRTARFAITPEGRASMAVLPPDRGEEYQVLM